MANNEGKELVATAEEAQNPFDMSLVASSNIIAVAEQAEKRLDALVKIKKVALKATTPGDWVDEGGKPYLQSSGAEKVGRIFGISWRISEPKKEELEGGHYAFTYTGEFLLWGAVITAVGTRSSKDPFFKKYKYAGDERLELPPSEIDEGDVKKSAYSNLLANGITRVLGIRNLTYADLKEYAEIRQDQVTRVEFKKHGKAPSSSGEKRETRQPTNGGAPASNDQVSAIHNLLTKEGVKDELAKMQRVKDILGLKDVPTSASKLTNSQASTVIAALQKQAGGEE
jgi:hypothetical protein